MRKSPHIINLAVILTILIIAGVACKPMNENSSNVAAPPPVPVAANSNGKSPTNKPANAPNPTTARQLQWSDYDRVYNTKSNSTDMQKDALWKDFEGQTVNWSGTVVDVSKGTFGGMTLNIKMNEDTITYDISLDLKKDQTDKAMALTKGKKVNFTGKLVRAGGAVLPLSMDEGEIK